MKSNLSDLENLIKLEPDSPAKTKKLHLVSELRPQIKKLLATNEGLDKRVDYLKSKVERYGLENESLRSLICVKKKKS